MKRSFEHYADIKSKKAVSDGQHLSDLEALEMTLDMMDFNAQLTAQNPEIDRKDDNIDWTELTMNDCQ